MINSLEDLEKLRNQAQKKMPMRLDTEYEFRIVVGMGTCGIAAGARTVLNTLIEELAQTSISVTVLQSGCLGTCDLEPIVEVYDQIGTKTVYTLMDAKKTKDVVHQHLINHQVQNEYTLKNNKE